MFQVEISLKNIHKILDAIDYTNKFEIPALFIAFDFEKAFDRVEYKSVFRVMQWMNFGPKLIEWIRVLFKGVSFATMNNGYTSDYIKPRGLFQGNPIASFLFVILIELLAVKIRKNRKIKGIKIKEEELLLTQFADDMGLLLDNNQQSWSELENVLNHFQNLSGMKINYDKTTIYRIGSLKHTNAKFYSKHNLHWSNQPVKVLGIIITNDQQQLLKLNYEALICKTEAIFIPVDT